MVTQASYQRAAAQVRDRLLKMASLLWGNLPSYRDRDIDRMVARIVPQVQAGQIQIANLTEAYFRQIGSDVGVDQWFITSLRGVDASEVYRRPATTVYTALADGKPYPEAVAEGGRRLASLIATDMQMAKVAQANRSLESAGVKSFRRVLTGRENCALCVIASTQRYRTGDLMPIHGGCDCGVDVLPPGWDPDEQVINPELLELTNQTIAAKLGKLDYGARDLGVGKTDAEGRSISDFTDLIITHEHGEHGPVLAWRDEKFTAKADIPALN